MSMRIKAAIVIVLIFLAVTVANYFSSWAFITRSITETMEQELSLALDIADDVIATKIGLLKSNAETVAERLLRSGSPGEMAEIMAAQMDEFDEFISFAVFTEDSVYASYGTTSAYGIFIGEVEYIQTALDGVKILTSPCYSGIARDFVIHVFVPMEPDKVLSATVPGMLFSDILSNYRLWQTGSMFIVDAEGTFVANYRSELVTEQRNFITDAQTDPDMASAGDFYRNMISTEDAGSGRYIYEGKERLCVYKYVTNSLVGWRMGVVAPLSESPQSSVRVRLLFAAVFFLAIGALISIFVSRIAVKPFVKIETQNRNLAVMMEAIERRDELLNTGNSTAEVLLSVEDVTNIESSLMASMELVGKSADADRVQIWRNETIDGVLHFVHTYQWLSDVGRQEEPVPYGLKFAYGDKPEWEEMFLRGECINGPVSELPPGDRAFLAEYGMKTIVIIPLVLHDQFWGFFSLDDCRNERTFTQEEIRILRSVSLMMANVLNRGVQAAKIREANEYTELLIEALPLSCNLWDKELNLFKCNDGSVRLFEVEDKSEFIEHFNDFSPVRQPDGRLSSDKITYVLQKAIDDGIFVVEWMHQKRDGTPIPTEVTLVRVAYGADYVVAAYVRDLREQKRMMDEINEIMRNLKSANAAKSEFLAKMSHEMRTPLNAIIGLSELALEDEAVREEARLNIEKVNNAGVTLLNTVNDILDLSKIEAGRLELVPVKYDMPSLLNDAITQSSMYIDEKPIEFILNISDDLPSQLYGDDLRIKQIFNNLLSNAFKYTTEGTVEFGVRCKREGEEKVWLTAWVRDTGVGIKPENLDALFEEFVKVDAQTHRNIIGTGLGLPITKKVAEMMGGAVAVESEYGKGSTFTVRLLQTFAGEATIGRDVVENLKNFSYSDQKRRENSSMLRVKLPYARVLVVDDTITNLDVAKGLMKPYEMQIDCVTDGLQAIEAMKSEEVSYNAIFMDHMMPGMDGIETTQRIRELGTDYARDIPIIACTANAIAGSSEMFLENGFQAFISKPIDIVRLDEIIRRWVRDSEQEELFVVRREGAGGDAAPDDRNGLRPQTSQSGPNEFDRRMFEGLADDVDTDEGVKRFGGDAETYLEILRSFAVNTRPLLENIRDAGEGDLTGYIIVVHGIKGACRGISAKAAGDMAEALEMAAKEGDREFLAGNNQIFIETIEKLIVSVEGLPESVVPEGGMSGRQQKSRPDEELLKKLLAACGSNDIGAANDVMDEIDEYDYEFGAGLVAWLRVNMDKMNYSQIAARLSTLV